VRREGRGPGVPLREGRRSLALPSREGGLNRYIGRDYFLLRRKRGRAEARLGEKEETELIKGGKAFLFN